MFSTSARHEGPLFVSLDMFPVIKLLLARMTARVLNPKTLPGQPILAVCRKCTSIYPQKFRSFDIGGCNAPL